jgi:hypothetical protein
MSRFASFASLAVTLLLAGRAGAAPTKEECVDAHGKAQDAREAGQLTEARRLFLACAQPACPELVNRDCARFADEIERLQPTVTFSARDGAQNDLLDTEVYVDGTRVASRLGDGKAHEIDPGSHEVRFVHAGKETILRVVVTQGEKGRALVGAFLDAGAPRSPGMSRAPDAPELRRPSGPLALVGLGAAAAVAGGVLLGVGFARIPAVCSLSSHACKAPPGDPVFARASSSVTMVNLGTVIGGVGALGLGGGLIWYFAQPPRPAKTARTLTPWVGPQGAGLVFSGAL